MSDRIYLLHPTQDETVGLPTGFSLPACLLGVIWALAKRLWIVALALLAVNVVICLVGFTVVGGDRISLILNILFAIYCGVFGNRWHRRTLERKGYTVLRGQIDGTN